MRVVIYCRISKDRVGAGLGVERQERLCRELTKSNGWDVVAVITDNDLSAYSGKRRPGYRAVLDGIAAGKFDGVVCWHNDRLHRSPTELEEYITVCQPRDVPTYTVQAGTLDLSTASGRMMARISGAVARQEVEHMSERIKAKKTEMAAEGRRLGGPRPFGFENDGVTIRQVEADAVAAGVTSVLAGETIAGMTRLWNQSGLRPARAEVWIPAMVRSVLLRSRNAGLMEHNGVIVGQAQWPAIVPESQWRALVRLLSDPDRRPKHSLSLKWQGSNTYLCGRCDDGTTMRSNSLWSRTRKVIEPAYRCRLYSHNTIKAEPTDEFVNEVFTAILRKRGVGLLVDSPDVDAAARYEAELRSIADRKVELAELFAADAIDKMEWAAAARPLKARLAEVESLVAGAGAGHVLSGIADAKDPGAAFLAASCERRRAVLGKVAVIIIGPSGARGKASAVNTDRIQIAPNY